MSENAPQRNIKSSGVEAFLKKVASTPVKKGSGASGRLIFAMDASASRQLSWDQAAHIQTEMFLATSQLGNLLVQLVFFRGFGEFKVSKWTNDSGDLKSLMESVSCLAGITQIRKVLKHTLNETKRENVSALVYIGDSMEEDIDVLAKISGELGLFGVPAFMFQEGEDPITKYAFDQIAKLSGGACVSFDTGAVGVLKELLGAVAVFATGGRLALESMSKGKGKEIKQLTDQIKRS